MLMLIFYSLAVTQPDAKACIAREQTAIEQEQGSKAEHLKNLAVLFFKDQNQEKAFDTFLLAIQELSKISCPVETMGEEEHKLFGEALEIYLNKSQPPMQIAQILEKKYSEVYSKHSNYQQLGFLLAAASANSGKFLDFFDLFFASYQKQPDHYLAYKGKAAIHAQLFARRRTVAEKEAEREAIANNLIQAITKFPRDTSLYQMLFTFAPENKKEALVTTYLNKIVVENIIVPRTDVVFYVQQAISIKQNELAKSFVEKSLEWYPNSRTLQNLFINE